jgi:hypothetical protein
MCLIEVLLPVFDDAGRNPRPGFLAKQRDGLSDRFGVLPPLRARRRLGKSKKVTRSFMTRSSLEVMMGQSIAPGEGLLPFARTPIAQEETFIRAMQVERLW